MNAFHYVYRQGGNPPIIKHPSFEAADTEAKRLAEQHKGTAFEILKCVAITQVTGPAVTERTVDATPIPKPQIKEPIIPIDVWNWLVKHKVDIDKLPFA